MFNAGGCASCHAVPGEEPAKVDRTRLGGGLAMQLAIRHVLRAEHVARSRRRHRAMDRGAIRQRAVERTSPARRNLYPAFPYTSYRHMQLNDMRDLFAYLKTLPPVQGKVREHDLSFPFNVRRLLGGWKCCSCTAGRTSRIRRIRRNGIAAPIW